MPLTMDKGRRITVSNHDVHVFPVKAGEEIYVGAFVNLDTNGEVINADGSTGTFLGVATVRASGGEQVDVAVRGILKDVVVTGLVAQVNGSAVFCADNDTINFTDTNLPMGVLFRTIDPTTDRADVSFKAENLA